jgi:hypothetical protein
MKLTDNYYTLSSGRKFYANNGVIGMSEFVEDEDFGWMLDLSEGYDGGINTDEFSKEELLEIADFMILQWQRYKSKVIELR